LELEVRPATGEAKPGVDFDQLSVEGTATFADGTTIRILLQPGKYRSVTDYLIVEGDDIQWNPAAINLELDGLFLSGSLQEGSVKLVLTSLPFESAATTANQQAVAAALSAALDDDDADLDDVFASIQHLGSGDGAIAQAIFESLTGEIYTQVSTLSARRTAGLAGSVAGALTGAQRGVRSFWANAFTDSGTVPGG